MSALVERILVFATLAGAFSFLHSCSDASQDSGNGARAAQIDGDAAREALDQLRRAMETEPDAVQRALLDPEGATLRDSDEFRVLVREMVVKHEISSLTLAPADEPGDWVEIEGQVVDAASEPIAGAVVTVFGTAEDGRYHPTIDGEETPRLFGYLLTDAEGKFSFRTVRPGPYPGTRFARHFHIWADAPGNRMAVPHYAVLDDDPLLAEPQNDEQRGEAIRVEMQPKDAEGIAHGRVVLPMR